MLARVADDLYWLGRYLQRAENTARLVAVNGNLQLDLPRGLRTGWAPLVDIVGAQACFRALYSQAQESEVVRFLMLDERHPGSMLASLSRAREILRSVRGAVPNEMWERLNELYWFVRADGERALSPRGRPEFLARLVDGCLALTGILVCSMSRDLAFQFVRIGANLEQADMTTRIVDVRSTSLIEGVASEQLAPFADIQWMSVLRSLDAYQMYRRHARMRVTGVPVLRFLLQDREFPRSVSFCLQRIDRALLKLPAQRPVTQALARVAALLRDADLEALIRTGLSGFLDEVQIGLGVLHDAIHAAYFRRDANPSDLLRS